MRPRGRARKQPWRGSTRRWHWRVGRENTGGRLPALHPRQDLLKRDPANAAAAEEAFHTAIAVAQQQKARIFELRAAMSMARLWRDQGKRDEARDLLAPVYGWFTEGFDTLDLKEAKALLDELASSSRSMSGYSSGMPALRRPSIVRSKAARTRKSALGGGARACLRGFDALEWKRPRFPTLFLLAGLRLMTGQRKCRR